MRHPALAIAALACVTATLRAQTWTPPRPPCDVQAGHFRINSAIVSLQTAAEKPTQRDRMLRQAQDVLVRSLTQDKQTNNPGAWYYLGRYYVEMGDAAGADSAFDHAEALAPQCAADIKTYRERLWTTALHDGLRNWQEGREDSAVVLLSRAANLVPTNPRPHFSLGKLYANRDAVDSATLWLRQGMQLAGTDTAFTRDRRDAMATLGRLYVRRAQTSPVFQQWQRTRYSRDSLERGIANDSTV
ncbi:MAG: tetratricopeptide repeat protein, partial [Gemmatimonadales bacterium]